MATYTFLQKRDGDKVALESLVRYRDAYLGAARGRRRFGRSDHFRMRYVSAAWEYRKLIRSLTCH